jgi:hypothetical protein
MNLSIQHDDCAGHFWFFKVVFSSQFVKTLFRTNNIFVCSEKFTNLSFNLGVACQL